MLFARGAFLFFSLHLLYFIFVYVNVDNLCIYFKYKRSHAHIKQRIFFIKQLFVVKLILILDKTELIIENFVLKMNVIYINIHANLITMPTKNLEWK